jgi:uncharacterized membrane protein
MEDKMTTVPPSDVSSDDKLWALLSWIIWPLAVVVLLMEDKKSRPFLKFHAVNSLAFGVVASVLVTIIGTITIGFGFCLGIAPLGFAIYWGVKAYNGEMVKVPFVTDFVHKQGWA